MKQKSNQTKKVIKVNEKWIWSERKRTYSMICFLISLFAYSIWIWSFSWNWTDASNFFSFRTLIGLIRLFFHVRISLTWRVSVVWLKHKYPSYFSDWLKYGYPTSQIAQSMLIPLRNRALVAWKQFCSFHISCRKEQCPRTLY